MGSRTALISDPPAMAYMVRLASPSPLKMAYAMLIKTTSMLPRKTILPYSRARPRASPAPMSTIRGSEKRSRTRVDTTETMITKSMACMVALSAPLLSRAPILREMAEEAPAPRPMDRPITTIKTGVTNPTAARASDPRPETQAALTTL